MYKRQAGDDRDDRDNLPSMDAGDMDAPLAWLDDDEMPTESFNDEDSCLDYESYLEGYRMTSSDGPPHSDIDYHLLEPWLEKLVGVEQESGFLRPEHGLSIDDSAMHIVIDPES